MIGSFATPAGWSRARIFAVTLMLAAQIALGVHQFQHHTGLDTDSESHCALCQAASGQDTGANPPLVVLPPQASFEIRHDLPSERAPHPLPLVADYQSRAPPVPVSI
jgi:hypothetical protein